MLMKDLFSKKTCVNGVQLVWLRKDVQQAFQKNELNQAKCFGCGMCAYSCPFGSFQMERGTVLMNWKGEMKELEVSCRQSDIKRARKLAEELKKEFKTKISFLSILIYIPIFMACFTLFY